MTWIVEFFFKARWGRKDNSIQLEEHHKKESDLPNVPKPPSGSNFASCPAIFVRDGEPDVKQISKQYHLVQK